MKIGVVCVNYNNPGVTLKLIESIEGTYNSKVLNIQIVIVDNSSNLELDTDDYETNIKIIKSSNIGYFPGLNVGLEFLYNESETHDFAIVGNNDLLFSTKFWEVLELNKSFLEKYYIVSPRIRKPNGDEQNPHVIEDLSNRRIQYLKLVYHNKFFFKYIRLFVKLFVPNNFRRKDELNFKVNQFIDQGHGSCYILTNKYLKQFKLPEETELYGEEFFLSKQLKNHNISIFYFHELSVIHNEHSSTNNVLSDKLFQMKKNAFKKELLIRKNI